MRTSFGFNRTARTLALLALGAVLLPAEAPAKRKKKPAANEAVVVGKVVDVNENVIVGASIAVTSETAADFRLEATADAEGAFTLRVEDPEGEYVFHVEAEGYAPFAGTVPLMAGEEANLGFKLLDAAAGARQEAVQAFNAGVQAFNQSQFDAAKAKFLEAVEKAPDMIEPHQGLAEIYYREKDLEAAAAAIERYLAVKPDDTSALTLAYTIHQESGNRERTEQLIDALAETEKAKPLARQIYNQGVAASQRGDDERAVERFRRASSLDPELAAAYSGEATILYNEARYDEAEAALEKLFALDPQNQQGRRMSFLVHDGRDDQTKAAEALEAYLAVDKDGAVDLMYQRADMDFRDGNRAKAIAALERILELSPNMARAHYTLGLCHMSADQSKAKQHLERFIELAPEDPEVASAEEMLSYLK